MAGYSSPSHIPLPTIAEESSMASIKAESQRQHQHHHLSRRLIALCSKTGKSQEEEEEEMEANFEKLCSKAPGCRPLTGILSNLLPCLHNGSSSSSSSGGSGGSGGSSSSVITRTSSGTVERSSSSSSSSLVKQPRGLCTRELLELSKRQQGALVDKQETIDMLEWQLEQLHCMAMKEREITGFCCRHVKSPSAHGENRGRRSQLPEEQLEEECCILSEDCVVGVLKSHQESKFPRQKSSSRVSMDMEITATELLLEMTIVRATLAIRRFCKLFMKQMEMSGYSVLRALADLEPRTHFAKKEHTAFALESRINKALFHCFENESFDQFGITKILDPSRRALSRLEEFQRMKLLDIADAVNPEHAAFEPEFLRFCENKTQDMWGLFPWSIVFKTADERNSFTAAFINACKGVWLLHRLSYSMNPAVTIIRVGPGMEMNPLYVEAVVAEKQLPTCNVCKSAKVEFMVMPGFRTLKKTVKCLVYMHTRCK